MVKKKADLRSRTDKSIKFGISLALSKRDRYPIKGSKEIRNMVPSKRWLFEKRKSDLFML